MHQSTSANACEPVVDQTLGRANPRWGPVGAATALSTSARNRDCAGKRFARSSHRDFRLPFPAGSAALLVSLSRAESSNSSALATARTCSDGVAPLILNNGSAWDGVAADAPAGVFVLQLQRPILSASHGPHARHTTPLFATRRMLPVSMRLKLIPGCMPRSPIFLSRCENMNSM
jgi:hypothetical protein